jgi:hypothetical protein
VVSWQRNDTSETSIELINTGILRVAKSRPPESADHVKHLRAWVVTMALPVSDFLVWVDVEPILKLFKKSFYSQLLWLSQPWRWAKLFEKTDTDRYRQAMRFKAGNCLGENTLVEKKSPLAQF